MDISQVTAEAFPVHEVTDKQRRQYHYKTLAGKAPDEKVAAHIAQCKFCTDQLKTFQVFDTLGKNRVAFIGGIPPQNPDGS